MTLLDWFRLAAFFVLGWILGSRATAALHRAVMRNILKDLGITPQQLRELQTRLCRELGIPDDNYDNLELIDREVIEIRLEQHNDCIYAFRKDNSGFLGQGVTAEELVKNLSWRFPKTHRLTVSAADGAELIGGRQHWQWDHSKKTAILVDKDPAS